ncbi:hypothetical protein FBU30_004053 [Linnemannia zychae]|nr:hypothetical protein FBU30_004053 [Linnemannia zychae]
MADGENVIESLQSLKNLAMLALDGLLQQVVSDVTSSDPVYNADETTLEARAIIRRTSIPLLQSSKEGAQAPSMNNNNQQGGLRTPEHEQEQQSLSCLKGDPQLSQEASARRTAARMSLSDMPIAGMATTSLERLDELVRKVDQLTVVTHTNTIDDTSSSSSLSRARDVLYEPLDIPSDSSRDQSVLTSHRRQQDKSRQNQLASLTQIHPSQIFESQEYQLACALAALLACIYRILNTMQQPRLPVRTESADSGLDQASRLWKRLSSNTFTRNPLRVSHSHQSNLREHLLNNNDSIDQNVIIPVSSSLPSSPEKKVLTRSESATSGFIQSINRQVRTLRSRRTQSTSQIEVQKDSDMAELGMRSGRLIDGATLHPQNTSYSMKSPLEHEWEELDKLMDEMSLLWQAISSLEDERADFDIDSQSDEERDRVNNPFDDSRAITQQQKASITSTWTPMTPAPEFDQQTLDMAALDELPQYDDIVPQYQYQASEKSDQVMTPVKNTRAMSGMKRLINRTSRSNLSSLDDEKTRFDLNNVMGAIERLSKVAPRMDNQRVQLSSVQKRQMAQANITHTIDQITKNHLGERTSLSSPSSGLRRRSTMAEPHHTERTRDLNKLMNQIAESAKAGFTSQRVELTPRQQWRLEGARIGERIERGEKMRLKDQDWQSPETVLINDMTRLTNALYQQTISSEAFATQRYTVSEDKARSMALHGIMSKIERVSGRRMGNQDALPSSKSKSSFLLDDDDSEESSRARELQEMINQMVESGGGAKRRSAMASQRAEFNMPIPRS